MRKVFILLFVLIISAGCQSTDNNLLEKQNIQDVSATEGDYVLSYDDFSFDWMNSTISLPYPVRSEEHHPVLNRKNLTELYKPLVSFYNEHMQATFDFYGAKVHLATSKYISVQAEFYSNNTVPRGYSIYPCVTIDLEKQEEVFLKDLIDTNEEFIQLLQEGNLIQADVPATIWNEFYYNADFSKYPPEEIRNIIDLCSVPTDNENCYTKPSFLLAPGKLCFVGADQDIRSHVVYIELSDIEEFLKVEKW